MSQSEFNSKEKQINAVISTAGKRERVQASEHFSERVRSKVQNHQNGVEPIQLRWLSYAAVASVLMLFMNIGIATGSLTFTEQESETVSLSAVESYFGLDETFANLTLEYPEVEQKSDAPNIKE